MDKFAGFIVYVCVEGEASVQASLESGHMERYSVSKGEVLLVPAEMPDFYLVPSDRSTILLEVVTRPVDEFDEYIDPSTEAFLENEDYEGLEDEDDDDQNASGASPLGFFGSMTKPVS